MKLQLSNTDYHKHPAIGASGLRLINEAPAKYYSAYVDPDRPEREETDAMKLGSLLHTAMLEPHKFDDRYSAMPEGLTRQSKEGKALHAFIIESGKTPIKQDDATLAKTVSGIFSQHPLIQDVMALNPIIEQSFTVDIDGIAVKIRPDIFLEPCKEYPNSLIIDPKSTQGSTLIDENKRIDGATPFEFAKSINRFEYWLQSALYAQAIKIIYELPELPPFIWFAQETKPPYLNKPYRATDTIQTYGWEECQRLLAIYRKCRDTDTWPGYGAEIEDAELPGWKMREIENDGGEIEVNYVND